MKGGAVCRLIQLGRPRLRPRALADNKAYTGIATRALLRRHRIRAIVPRRRNEHSDARHRFDRAAYHKRNCIEQLINRLNQFRRVATRSELPCHARPRRNHPLAVSLHTRPSPPEGKISIAKHPTEQPILDKRDPTAAITYSNTNANWKIVKQSPMATRYRALQGN